MGKSVPLPIALKINNTIYDKTEEILPIFKEHWTNIFKPHESFIRTRWHEQNINKWKIQNMDLLKMDRIIQMDKLDNSSPLTTPILPQEVMNAIKNTKNKTPRPTDINKDVLSHLPNNIINFITDLFKASLSTGHYPKIFKIGHIILIPKTNKDLKDPGSYRPITLLDTIGKIFEKLINIRLRQHIETNNILPNFQYGFRRQKNTQAPTIMITDLIQNAKSRHLKAMTITN